MAKQPVVVELDYGGQWNAVPLFKSSPITITWGRGEEQADVTPCSAELTIDDRTGLYNPENPASPLYGLVGRNTPLRVAMRPGLTAGAMADAADVFARTSVNTWDAAPVGGAWSMLTAGGGAVTWFQVTPGAGKHNVVNANAFAMSYLPALQITDATVSITVAAPLATGAQLEPANLALRGTSTTDYVLIRVTLQTDNSVGLLVFDAADNVLGSVTVPGLVHAGVGTPLRVQARMVGRDIFARVYPAAGPVPAGWHLRVSEHGEPAAGWIGVRSGRATGNTNAAGPQFTYSAFSVVAEDARFTGEVASWDPDQSPEFTVGSGRGSAWTDITANGVLRRIGQGTDPLHSALYRYNTLNRPSFAHWPLEDPERSTQAANTVAGGAPMIPVNVVRYTTGSGEPVTPGGAPAFAAGVGPPGAGKLVSLTDGGTLRGVVLQGGAVTFGYSVEFVVRFAPGAADGSTSVDVLSFDTFSTYRRFWFNVTATQVTLFHADVFGTTAGSASGTFNMYDGTPHHVLFTLAQSGPNLLVRMYIDGNLIDTSDNFGSPMAGTVRMCTAVELNPLEDRGPYMPVAIGGVNVHPDEFQNPDAVSAAFGWPGEPAAFRMAALLGEEGYAFTVAGASGDTMPMGPQYPDTLMELLREAERTDDGMLYEPRNAIAVRYRTRADLYAQEPALELTFTDLARPFRPTVDDYASRNHVTVKRREGGEETAILETGPMSVQAPPAGIGRTKSQPPDVNPVDDSYLPDMAGWRLHKGTIKEIRFPRVTVQDRDDDPGLIQAAAAVGVGDVLTIGSLPARITPDLARGIVLGGTEVIESHGRKITFNCAPASAYDVGVFDDARADTAGAELAAAFTSGTHTSMSVATTVGPLWLRTATHPTEFPLYVRAGGVVLEVTAIAGAASPQTFTVTAAPVNGVVKTLPIGTPVALAFPALAGL